MIANAAVSAVTSLTGVMTVEHAPTDAEVTETGISRRSIVRAGATAAWAVPLVTVATAAPALAVSGAAVLEIRRFEAKFNRPKKDLDLFIYGVRNTGTVPSSQVTVVFSIPRTKTGALSRAPRFISNSKGWTFVGRTGNATWDFTFASTSGIPAGKVSPTLKVDLRTENAGKIPPSKVIASVFANGASPTAASDWIK